MRRRTSAAQAMGPALLSRYAATRFGGEGTTSSGLWKSIAGWTRVDRMPEPCACVICKQLVKYDEAAWVSNRGNWVRHLLCQVRCICCQKVIDGEEDAMISPGKYWRHSTCEWPRQARGVGSEPTDAAHLERLAQDAIAAGPVK